jgi:hypothetical protein
MPEFILTQAEADALLAMDKYRADDTLRDFPELGGYLSVELISEDKRERFLLDIQRGRIDLSKVTYQNRAHRTIILARLDIAGPPHRNPDGVEIECPHLHLYREGSADKWAAPIDPAVFPNTADLWATLERFMDFCHVVDRPNIQRGLFV